MSGNNIPIATLNTWPGMVAELIVAIPAHNEQDSIAGCVAAVWRSIEIAVRAGQVSRALVTVSAHRCRDATAAFAETALARGPAVMPAVASVALRIDERSATVGAVRAGMISAAYQQLPAGSDSWLFNTDADSIVPPEWVVETLGHAQVTGAVAVAGLVDVVGWRTTEAARRRYRQIIEQGMTSTGHRHVYGANLAVRLDAYLAAGGFSSVPRGEDTGLVNSLRAAGYQVASTFTPVVVTSGRVPGRARQGLGALLGELTSSDPPATVAERLLRR